MRFINTALTLALTLTTSVSSTAISNPSTLPGDQANTLDVRTAPTSCSSGYKFWKWGGICVPITTNLTSLIEHVPCPGGLCYQQPNCIEAEAKIKAQLGVDVDLIPVCISGGTLNDIKAYDVGCDACRLSDDNIAICIPDIDLSKTVDEFEAIARAGLTAAQKKHARARAACVNLLNVIYAADVVVGVRKWGQCAITCAPGCPNYVDTVAGAVALKLDTLVGLAVHYKNACDGYLYIAAKGAVTVTAVLNTLLEILVSIGLCVKVNLDYYISLRVVLPVLGSLFGRK